MAWVALCSFDDAHARERIFELKNDSKISVNIPDGWKTRQGFLNIPLIIQGPMRGGHRSVVNVYPSNSFKLEIDPKNLKDDYQSYKQGKQDWISKRFMEFGKILRWLPYRYIKNKHGEYHFAGFEYEAHGKKIQDRSVYYFCKKNNRMFLFKSVVYFKNKKSDEKKIDRLLKTLRCVE